MTKRKLTATFADGSTLTRTTTMTITHAWKVTATRLSDKREITTTGFATGADKAHAAPLRELPTSRFTGHRVEVVACTER